MHRSPQGESPSPIDTMTDEERFAELGRILAAGIFRMLDKSSWRCQSDAKRSPLVRRPLTRAAS